MKITLTIEADDALLEELQIADREDEGVTLKTGSLSTTVFPRIVTVD